MKKLTITVLLGVCAFAQDNTSRIVEVKYLDPYSLSSVTSALRVSMSGAPGSHLVVLTGSKENVAAAEEALKRFDVPRKSIDLTFQVLDALMQPGEEKIPADLESVVKQLRSSFVYKGFRLVDTLQLRTQEGTAGAVTGTIPREKSGAPIGFLHLDFHSTSVSDGDKGPTVHVDRLRLNSKVPNGVDGKGMTYYAETGIETSIDVPDGKKVVVGKANMNGEAGAYFLIVTAKVVD
jgi:hypothetical protein